MGGLFIGGAAFRIGALQRPTGDVPNLASRHWLWLSGALLYLI